MSHSHLHLFTLCFAAAVSTLGCASSDVPAADDDAISAAAASACGSGLLTNTFKNAAHTFMSTNSLIKTGEEQSFPVLGISVKWSATSIKAVPARYSPTSMCVVTMNLETETTDNGVVKRSAGDLWEVLAYNPSNKVFQKFESSFTLPAVVFAGFGGAVDYKNPDGTLQRGDQSQFYAELSGANLVSGYKVILSGIAATVLSGKLSAKNIRTLNGTTTGDADGKAPFDPTPGRTWKLKDVTVNLRRGATAEVHDIYPGLIDTGGFSAAFEGTNGFVAPWDSSSLRSWRLPTDTTWKRLPQTVAATGPGPGPGVGIRVGDDSPQ